MHRLFSDASEAQLDRLRAVSTPAGMPVQLTGTAQINRDSSVAITERLPVVLAVIAAITFVLLFLLTGSVILPLKALVLNVLSLTAAFGALVWIFQDGHLGALGTTPTGTLVANMPVLLFCIAFGLSMDYEVFLVSRIREYWLSLGGKTRADNDEAVALGLARTGRVVTAAALGDVDFVRGADRRTGCVHADVRRRADTGDRRRRHPGADGCWCPRSCTCSAGGTGGRPKPLVRLHARIGISESTDDLIPPGERRERAPVPATETG